MQITDLATLFQSVRTGMDHVGLDSEMVNYAVLALFAAVAAYKVTAGTLRLGGWAVRSLSSTDDVADSVVKAIAEESVWLENSKELVTRHVIVKVECDKCDMPNSVAQVSAGSRIITSDVSQAGRKRILKAVRQQVAAKREAERLKSRAEAVALVNGK